MGVFVGKGYGLVRVREHKSTKGKSVLEELNASLPPGYSLDTSTGDTHLLHRADGSLVCAFLPELASREIVRRVAERDTLVATSCGELARPR